ncbi:tripartite tricarboxylate transporter substrate-binding protein [Variovorax sp. OAS795]|uniref:tripartite tricarboxylate transporter substrate-binding protein n=1 Tax=Variovorax sp. OAS795 TaxID=3034231 RepID=UPI0033999AE3
MFAPPGTPAPVIERLNQALNTVLQKEALKAPFRELGMVPRAGPPSLLIDQVRHDTDLYRRVIHEAKLKFE